MDITGEVKSLLNSFHQKGEVSFKAFRQLWKEMHISDVHHNHTSPDSSSPSDPPAEYMHALYYTFLSYLFLDPQPAFIVRVGVIYGIYLLYYTQLISPKAKLTTTLTVWQVIKETIADIKQARLADAYQCFKKLSDDGGIYYSAVLNPAAAKVHISENEATAPSDIDPASSAGNTSGDNDASMQDDQSEDGDGTEKTKPEVIDMAAIERIAKLYGLAKFRGSAGGEGASSSDSVPAPPASAPPSLNVAHADLPVELKAILVRLQKSKEDRLAQAGLHPHNTPLFTTARPPL